jgi:hypothetical protein
MTRKIKEHGREGRSIVRMRINNGGKRISRILFLEQNHMIYISA